MCIHKYIYVYIARDKIGVQASFQDHMLYQPSHLPKIRVGFNLGQVPLGALGQNSAESMS